MGDERQSDWSSLSANKRHTVHVVSNWQLDRTGSAFRIAGQIWRSAKPVFVSRYDTVGTG
jgi:hypothetical protein